MSVLELKRADRRSPPADEMAVTRGTVVQSSVNPKARTYVSIATSLHLSHIKRHFRM